MPRLGRPRSRGQTGPRPCAPSTMSGAEPTVSVCVPVHRAHGGPNLASLTDALPDALGDVAGELIVALGGISSASAGVRRPAQAIDLSANLGVAPAWNRAAAA